MNRQQNNEAKSIPAGTRRSPKKGQEETRSNKSPTEGKEALKKKNTSLYFVVWVQGEQKPQAAATDPTTAEEIAAEISRNRSGCSVWITKEDRPPEGVKIDRRMTAARIYDDFVQDEQRRSACRCCANCGNFITEYGETFCRLDAISETADPCKFSCPEWV